MSSMWVEGVGDEVVYALGAIFGLFLPVLIISYQRQQGQVIHPESEENVRAVREEVNQQRQQESQAGDGEPNHNEPARDIARQDCPICLSEAVYAIQTNCSHIFCGECLVTYWQYGHFLGAMKCPVCRQNVTLLLINFSNEEQANQSREKAHVVDSINRYNRRFSGEPRTWRENLQDLPTLLRHAVSEFFSVGGLVMMFRIRIVLVFILALLYFISPLDIIPEAVFGVLGFLDDIVILLLLATYVSIIYRNVVQERATRAN